MSAADNAMVGYVTHIMLKFQSDPLLKFRWINSIEALLRQLGLGPSFVDPWITDITFKDQITSRYGFPLHWTEVEVTDDGVYKSAHGDPDLYPILQGSHKVGPDRITETVYFYEYALIAVVAEGKPAILARID